MRQIFLHTTRPVELEPAKDPEEFIKVSESAQVLDVSDLFYLRTAGSTDIHEAVVLSQTNW